MASIYQTRNDRWTAQVNVGGKRQSKTFDSKTEARRWARHLETAIDTGERKAAAPTMTFSELVEEYIAAIAETKDVSRGKLNALKVICEIIGRRKVADLDVDAFRDFVRQRRNAVSTPGPATIGMDLTYIHTILMQGGAITGTDNARALHGLKSARMILTTSNAIARTTERSRRPSEAELLALRDFWAKRRRGIPMWTLTQFAIASAMRLGEICRIRWDDLDTEGRLITIRDRKDPKAKIGNDQTVPLLRGPCTIDGAVVDPLDLILSMPREEARIFPFDSKTVSTMFSRGVSICGIDDLRYHDLRHDGVSRLFEDGYQIEQVAIVSGHKSWDMLKRYTQIKPESLHRD